MEVVVELVVKSFEMCVWNYSSNKRKQVKYDSSMIVNKTRKCFLFASDGNDGDDDADDGEPSGAYIKF